MTCCNLINQKGVTTLLVFLITKLCFCQTSSSEDSTRTLGQVPLKKSNFSVELGASVLGKAAITRDMGNYTLHSRLQSAFDAGINYIYNVNKGLAISSGLHVVIGKRNYYSKIPPEDLRDFYNSSYPLLLEDKDIWGAIKIPLMVEKKFDVKKRNFFSLKTGLTFCYSGFMPDETFGWLISKPDGQVVEIFSADYFAKNHYKPWLTYSAGFSKFFLLNNYNFLSAGLLLNISTTSFFEANYSFQVPNQPVTSGTYKISGTSLGLSVQYIFTGTNKMIMRQYERKNKM